MNLNVNQITFEQEKEFYNKFMQKLLEDYDILTSSTYNDGKSVDAEPHQNFEG